MYRTIPSTDKCLQALKASDSDFSLVSARLLKQLVTNFWDRKRAEIRTGQCDEPLDLDSQLPNLIDFVRHGLRPNLRPVINATGVVIHTNLGRSVLADKACDSILQAARAYSNLEMDLQTGERGSRQSLISSLICDLTGAEDAMVVNNNAAAVLIMLDTLCSGGETIVSRGELVEIGGSFRIPDIMSKSGTILREVGTTNRTHLEDYRAAITDATKAIMRVHASNFRIIGFHCDVPLKELKTLAIAHNLPLIFDLGSGNLLNFSETGLPPEPTVREILAEGADLVSFSGDKALGGSQAGIIAGKANLIAKLKKNPLARALRCDKLCLAALETTLRLYLDPEVAKREIPTLAMITISPQSLAKNAKNLAASLRRAFARDHVTCQVRLVQGSSRVGGGSYPECELPTTLVALSPANLSATELRERLLNTLPPIIGRLDKDAFCLDPRTLSKKDYPLLINAIVQALKDKN